MVVVQQPIVYDYSQPISTTATQPTQAISDQAGTSFDQARAAFKLGNYSLALDLTDQALRQLPNDVSLHEFRALVLFALQRYDEAATALYAVLSTGPGWDWPTLIGLYPDVNVYTGQLRALESAIRQNPQSAAARFVLAYHYITAGHLDAAINQLKDVTQLQPRDIVATQLLRQLQEATQGTPGSCRNRTGARSGSGRHDAIGRYRNDLFSGERRQPGRDVDGRAQCRHNDSPDLGRRRPLHLESHEPGEVSRISGGRNLREWNPDACSIRPGCPAADGRPGDLA